MSHPRPACGISTENRVPTTASGSENPRKTRGFARQQGRSTQLALDIELKRNRAVIGSHDVSHDP